MILLAFQLVAVPQLDPRTIPYLSDRIEIFLSAGWVKKEAESIWSVKRRKSNLLYRKDILLGGLPW